jgi:hypothetical protein
VVSTLLHRVSLWPITDQGLHGAGDMLLQSAHHFRRQEPHGWTQYNIRHNANQEKQYIFSLKT